MVSPYIFTGLEKALQTLPLLAHAIPVDALDLPTHPGRFTARAALAHWADWDRIHFERIEAALTKDGAPVPDVSEADEAEKQGHPSWPIERSIETFVNKRAILVELLDSLEESEMNRTFVHSKFGKQTIAGYAGHILGHDAYHIEQLLEVVLRENCRNGVG